MPNLNYAQVWEPELLEILMQGALTSPFVTTNVRWLDAKTFHFTQMSTSGYKNHNRNGGWNKGNYVQKDVPFTVTHDRDISFLVDKADVDETNATASIQNISRTFEQTQVVPETDALFFSKVAQAAQKEEGYHSTTAIATYTKAKVFGMLKDILAKGKLRRYKANGSLVMYVSSAIMDALEQSTEFTRKIELTQIAEGGIGIETRVTDIDGVAVMEVVDDERFYDAFDWEPEAGGFEPQKKVASGTAKAGAHKINVLVACGQTCKTVPKISSIYYFEPGAHTEGDGYLYQNRSLSDVFVFPNGKDGKVDSVFVDVDTAEFGG
ncbi:phage capsid protein [Clostridium sp. AF02-29]|uniref:phage capsid protein n=1 Tax=Clostridium sp. AF02-29 TaxID=2292993 RepID=UPI002354876C|nr:phage capsid protein [Clostridium sp. AF02-29]